jgi:uncharacterized protein YdeI (YjbR/CyaY-like superfamily)
LFIRLRSRATGRLGRCREVRAAQHTMEIGETLCVTSRRAFRTWLKRNHDRKAEIWLVQYKKATGMPTIDYIEALEEAICCGWIDGLARSIDGQRYATCFTPRRPRSHWTNQNRERASRMTTQGRMTEAGRMKLRPDFRREPGHASPGNGIARPRPRSPEG